MRKKKREKEFLWKEWGAEWATVYRKLVFILVLFPPQAFAIVVLFSHRYCFCSWACAWLCVCVYAHLCCCLSSESKRRRIGLMASNPSASFASERAQWTAEVCWRSSNRVRANVFHSFYVCVCWCFSPKSRRLKISKDFPISLAEKRME